MKKYSLYLAYMIFFSCDALAQNILNNPSFELSSTPSILAAQCDRLLNWNSRTHIDNQGNTTYFHHSPDFYTPYYENFRAAPINGYAGAHLGNNYIGMAPYEIIYQGVPDFEASHLYFFSAFIKTSDYLGNHFDPTYFNGGSFTLKVKLGTHEFEYACEPPTSSSLFGCGNSEDSGCNEDYCKLKQNELISSDVTTVLSFPIGLQNFPIGGGWTKIEGAFLAPEDFGFQNRKYNWIGFELTKDN